MCDWMFNGTGFPTMIFGGIMMLMFWSLIFWTAIYIVRKLTQGRLASTNGQAIRILQERYARGEIDSEEYKEKFKKLF